MWLYRLYRVKQIGLSFSIVLQSKRLLKLQSQLTTFKIKKIPVRCNYSRNTDGKIGRVNEKKTNQKFECEEEKTVCGGCRAGCGRTLVRFPVTPHTHTLHTFNLIRRPKRFVTAGTPPVNRSCARPIYIAPSGENNDTRARFFGTVERPGRQRPASDGRSLTVGHGVSRAAAATGSAAIHRPVRWCPSTTDPQRKRTVDSEPLPLARSSGECRKR